MHKHLSTAMLLCRFVIYKLFLILLAAVVIECALFCLTLRDLLPGAADGSAVILLENVIDQSHIAWVSGGGFLLLCLALALSGRASGSRVDYTVQRLCISEKHFFFWHSLTCAGAFLIYWAVQAGVSLVCSAIFCAYMPPEQLTVQAVYLAFWRSDYLHALIPLSDVQLWIRNAVMLLALSCSAAVFSYKQRRFRFGGEIWALASATIAWFSHELGNGGYAIFQMLCFLAVGIVSVWHVCADQTTEESNEDE